MILAFHADLEQIFVPYISTHLLLLHIFANKKKKKNKHNCDIKHFMSQDQTCCFNYFNTQKL